MSESVAYRKLGLHSLSLYEANRLLVTEPQSAPGHLMRGLACKEFGEWKHVFEEFDAVIKIDPTYASGVGYYFFRSLASTALGDYENALADSKRYEEMSPGIHAEAMQLQGIIYDKLGDEALAVAAFKECHIRNPSMAIPEKYASMLN